jgi:acetolactate synthase-1/2/3 large subunit
MPLYDPLVDAGIELVHTRHEAAAVHMADAYARLTERPCPVLLTAGPGHANALGALYTARMAESPVVVLSGASELANAGRGAFQEMDQAGLARRVCKAAWVVKDAGALARVLARAWRLAAEGTPGPVSLSLPADVLRAPVSDGPRALAAAVSRLGLDASAQAVADARRAGRARPGPLPEGEGTRVTPLGGGSDVESAKRPLLLCGPAWSRGARWRAVAASGVPALPMESPRGGNDPALGAAKRVLARADVVLLLGKRRDFTLAYGRPPLFAADARFVELDAPPPAGRVDPAWAAEVEAARRARPQAPEGAPLHPMRLALAADELLGRDDVFVSDGGEVGQWAQAGSSCPNRVINGPSGAIGGALPFAIGAKLARPEARVVALSGDGAFGYHVSELHTAVRLGVPFVLVVGNDAQWNAEVVIQRGLSSRRLDCLELGDLRYDAVARAFGAHAERVDEPAELRPALQRAAAASKPAVVDVRIAPVPAPTVA